MSTVWNVIIILFDDMGYSDPQYMGGEAQMPHISRLADEGVTFLNCMNNAKCAPTRCALMSGMNSKRLGIQGEAGGDFIENNAACIAEVLGDSGYTTILSGKWHIRTEPLEAGFQYRFGERYRASYFKDSVKQLMHQDQSIDKSSLPDDWYSTIAYTDHAIKTIKEEAIDKDKPFFLYYSVHTPHFDFHAPKKYVDKYKGRYDAGLSEMSNQRYNKMVDKGIIDPATWKLPPLSHDGEQSKPFKWEGFNSKEQRLFTRKLEVIAGMLDVADEQVGRIITMLKETKQYENTLIFFLSDNGACAVRGKYGNTKINDMKMEEIAQLGVPPFAHAGDSGSAVAAFQNTPLRGAKQSLWGGGMRTSMIVNWPGNMASSSTDTYIREPVQIMGIAPTIYAATGTNYPANIGERKLNPMDGSNILTLLKGHSRVNRDFVFSYKNYRMARKDKWKLVGSVKDSKKYPDGHWQLFDLENDPAEMTDLSANMPEITNELRQKAMELHNQYPTLERKKMKKNKKPKKDKKPKGKN
ncbi:sulfatase-like hydrolase/transferase [Lentisphaera marina]|uniref:sulfatase-like hydrolase/transferase n=1 Tax=Lentisphaera marina TaxID=1111041 RepID=UPI0023653DEB|nr:sulfatase-like hydrolase/transferase [Lentisphaera marina]MDD7986181.1 sulfatase-like hydrolase/transferase [Lentisphaera marina]